VYSPIYNLHIFVIDVVKHISDIYTALQRTR